MWSSIKTKVFPSLFLRFSYSGMASVFVYISVHIDYQQYFQFQLLLNAASSLLSFRILYFFLYLIGHEKTSSVLRTSVIGVCKFYSLELGVTLEDLSSVFKMWISLLNIMNIHFHPNESNISKISFV